MLTVTDDRLAAALGKLDPEARALLELSARGGVDDGQVAELLRVEVEEVRLRREVALRDLADDLRVEPGKPLMDRLGQHIGDRWPEAAERRKQADRRRRAAERREHEERERREADRRKREADRRTEEREAVEEPVARPVPDDVARAERRRWPLALAGGLLLALIVALVLALAGDEDGGSGGAEAPRPAPTPAPRPAADRGPVVRLQSLNAPQGASASVRVVGRRLRLRLRGLPKPSDAYAVWLYNGIDDARQLARLREGTAELDLRLPEDVLRYRSIDISEEPDDGNANHSGASVMRVPLRRLIR